MNWNNRKSILNKTAWGLLAASLMMGSCRTIKHEPAMKTLSLQQDTISLLRNPCMGWGVYDDADGQVQQADAYWKAQDEAARQYASFFYVRWRWSEMEPEEGKYAWEYDENYKKLIQGALDRGLKLCFRIYNNSQDNWAQSTPDYVRQAGAKGYEVKGYNGNSLWTPYPDDPVFLEKLDKFVAAFAREYDNPAVVDFVDAYNVGFWGECHSIRLQKPGAGNLEHLLDTISTIYSSHFKNVMLVLPFNSQVGFEAEKRIAIEPKGYSMRRDGLGSMWYTKEEQNYAYQMYGRTLLIGESCWWKSCSDDFRPFATDRVYRLNNWRDVYEQTYKHALEGHFNTLDLREIPETTGWTTRASDLVQGFIRKGGYRIYPTGISYPKEMRGGDSLRIAHFWLNTASGYLPNNVKNWRYKYKPAFALLDKEGNVVWKTVDYEAEPSHWLQNQECHYVHHFVMDERVKKGKYTFAVALVNTENDCKPEIKLAIDRPEIINGWYALDKIQVK